MSDGAPLGRSAHPELLAPAGDWECLRAAVANGADAVYFGLEVLNARLRAENFKMADLPHLMLWLHERGCRGYVTLNTLVFTAELDQLVQILVAVHNSGVDAVIVQDWGAMELCRRLVPDLEMHASTQATLTSPEGVAFAKKLGISRAVVARELSLRELVKFRRHPDTVPLEVFVHGALCVAYSGQCLTSEALGRRSANRGECAQACRLPYDLLVDGQVRDLGGRHYLLSPQDLAAVNDIPALIEAGVASFKIEGRLKAPEYVAAVCQVYRRAIDDALAARPRPASPEEWQQLESVFSRGLFSGWMHGVDHQQLVHGTYGKKRGPFLGRVVAKGRDFLEMDSVQGLVAGDGVCFENPANPDEEEGGRVWQIRGKRLFFQRGAIRPERVAVGARVWKTSDPRLEKRLRRTFEKDIPPSDRPVDVQVGSDARGHLVARFLVSGGEVRVVSSIPLIAARQRGLDEGILRAQLGRLGGTGWTLRHLKLELEGAWMLPIRELNRMRREAVALLETKREMSVPHRGRENKRVPEVRAKLVEILERIRPSEVHPVEASEVIWTVLCRDLQQVEAALGCGVTQIILDFEDLRRYREGVDWVRQNVGPGRQVPVVLATPRIQKAGEEGFFRLMERAGADGVLIRNPGAIEFFQQAGVRRLWGDFSLNITNPVSAQVLHEAGLERLSLSYDLEASQVLDLLRAAPPQWFELTLHQHIPMFHMEHCVFAAFLSDGTDHTNCGRPCDRHRVSLRDRVGMEHPVKADVGCRNTVFHGRAQSGAAHWAEFLQAGLRHYRIELLNENEAQARRILGGYQKLQQGLVSAAELMQDLGSINRLGVTSGTLDPLAVAHA